MESSHYICARLVCMDNQCRQEACDRPARFKGFCEPHYRKDRQKQAPQCSVDRCTDPSRAAGLCERHYKRKRSSGSVHGVGFTVDGTMRDRFNARIKKTVRGCWLWQASKSDHGYGYFYYGSKLYKAHRLAYEFRYGPIPPGLYVLHHCDNPSCVRPDHLYAGTQKDNMRDRKVHGAGYQQNKGKRRKL